MSKPSLNPIAKATPECIRSLLSQAQLQQNVDWVKRVAEIQARVQKEGDAALRHYARQFDKAELKNLRVTPQEIEAAFTQIDPKVLKALKVAQKNITRYHRQQRPKNWRQTQKNGTYAGVQYGPLNAAGLYVPGGRANYPSTVLMNAIPAAIAGVPHRVMTTPPRADGSIAPELLVAAALCDVHTIIKSGGAQAIFALAYGTESVPKVDKIVGPGNVYVTLAKQAVYGQVDIDKPAGPSEVLVVVDDLQFTSYAAAEMLAQLEHDPEASAVVLSTKEAVLKAVQAALQTQFPTCSRQEILEKSIQNAHFLCTQSEAHTQDTLNALASEHVVILRDDADSWLPKIRHAGSIFLGPHTPVALGDYIAGPNHVLPTAGAARFASPLGVMDFMKYSAYLHYTPGALLAAEPHLHALTSAEGFDAHYNAVRVRL